MPEPILVLDKLEKHFGGLAVTQQVSLDLRPGEIHALIGPNGAGKTTLIHLVSGTLRPDAGRVLLDGRDVTRLSLPQRARLGLARSFQITCVIPGFSALENVALALQAGDGSSFRFFRAAHHEARLNDAARATLDEVGLGARATIPAGALSHGERRQLELAVAIATQPRLLLLDEPLAGAGPEETERLIGLLQRLKARCPILLVEHDMQAVFALADRISVLNQGQLIVTGSAAQIQAHPEVQTAYLGEDEFA
ncbi:ABC transporter ATP-binding protein [Pseudoroseomonas deserti]|uniref:ABC transporter ATP-binding protein n=1 Tax=Teichococcus deserti TaxID=1817963 RepID=A0A1V2H1D5_9PROT|nr:ABC transporter ATP-binding protein [Pseudoroseomonas deserti]ONG52755.1 ABC transporter ATP-binding protein [Pseudoroseomonas deserti]